MDGHESDTSQPKKTGELEASQVVLETVHDVAELSPVPFLKEAAGCALAILGVVDKMIKYKETTKRLALYACEAIYTVQCGTSGRWDGRQTENRELGESLAEFKATLDNIKQFAEKLTRKPYFFRLIASNLDQQEIASFQTKLNHATDMFILWLNIRSHGSLLEICNNTRYIPVAQLTDPESDTVTLTSSSYALNDFPSQPPLPPKDPQLGGSINGADSVNPLVKNISGNQVNSSALTKHEPPSRMVSGKSEGNFEARGPIESHKNDLSDTSGRVSRGETHEEPSNLDSSPLSNSSSSSPAPTVTAASRPFSSRRALTRALEFAREAVQLDSTNEHPDLAVQAFGKSLALLGEVMKRVRREKNDIEKGLRPRNDIERGSRTRNRRQRSVASYEEELKRLQNIYDTYADRMNILSIIYSIPPLPDTFSASDTEELPQPASPHNEGHEPHYTNSNHTLAEDHADHDRADDGHAAIGAAMLFEDYQQDEGEEQNYKNQHREPIKNPSVYPITRKQPSPMTENEPTLTDSSATTVVAVESKSMEETMIIETADDLRRILVLDNGVDVISTLEDSQVPLTVDLLLSEIRANVVDPSLYEYHKKCIKSLRRLVDKHGDLPKSLFINDIVRKSSRALIRGGFADIWKGTFRDQEVCLKVCYVSTVATKDNNKIVQGFYKEALIWTQLSHDNLLPFLGVTELFDPDFCLVSPWMENGHIITFLQRNPDHDKLEVITQIAAGMSYLHSLGVVHSDIKGANVLVDDDLNCRLADFGLSTDTNASLASRMSGIKGTYRWMAPELLDVSRLSESEAGGKGKPDKLKRDVYSYGCTVFEIITGEPPFSEMSEPKFVVEVAVNHKRPPRPTDVAWCPDNIWALVQLCWAQETHLRPTASSVHSYLERLVDARRSGLSWERKFPPPVVGS